MPGASVVVIQDARVAWQRAFGVADAESGARVDERTVFEAASVSKTVFAYAAMQLRDRGLLSLDTPLTTYTTDRILEGDPRLDQIAARHVLSHTSGLPNFRSGGEPLAIQFTPGERYRYSGEGYWYLQSVLTRLAGSVDAGHCGAYEAGLRVCATDIDRGVQAFAAASVPRQSGYVVLTNSDNGWKVFYDERFKALMDTVMFG